MDSEGLGLGKTRSCSGISHTCIPGRASPRARGLGPDTASAPRCVVLKLASLGMFSFSLGQTILCIGRNTTSCESYGYNACDYQVAHGSIRVCPFCAPPCPFEPLVPPQVSPQGEAMGRAATPQPTTRGAIHTTLRPGGWCSQLWGFPAQILPSKPGF